MDKYSRKIIKALDKNGIKGVYNKAQKLVYVSHQSQYGEIFGVHEYSDGTINSSVVYSHPVPQGRKKQVAEYLSHSADIKFYIEHLTTHVVLDTNYLVEKEESQALDEFCVEAYTRLIQNQQAVFEIVADKKFTI